MRFDWVFIKFLGQVRWDKHFKISLFRNVSIARKCKKIVRSNPIFESSTLISKYWCRMMTSSNGTIFRITGHLCGEFTGQRWIPVPRPVTRSFDVFFDLHLNKRLSKQSWGWWFETPSRPLWRHRNGPVALRPWRIPIPHNPCLMWLVLRIQMLQRRPTASMSWMCDARTSKQHSCSLSGDAISKSKGYPDTVTRFMGPTWGPSGTDRTQVGPILAPRTLLSG